MPKRMIEVLLTALLLASSSLAFAQNQAKETDAGSDKDAKAAKKDEKPIPPEKKSLNLPMSYLLKDFWKYPSDQVPY